MFDSINGHAQQVKFEYEISESVGLTSNNISDVIFDKRDQLWIATSYGLNKFDGSNLVNYIYNPLDTNSIPANFIGKLFTGFENDVWATLAVGGLCQYQAELNKFYYYAPEDGNRNAANDVLSLEWDEHQNAFLSTKDGIYRLSYGASSYSRMSEQPDGIVSQIKFIDNTLWVASDKGLYFYDACSIKSVDTLSTKFIALDDNNQVLYGNDKLVLRTNRSSRIEKIYECIADSIDLISNHKEYLLFSTTQNKLYKYDFSTDKIIGINLVRPVHQLMSSATNSFVIDKNMSIWLLDGADLKYYGELTQKSSIIKPLFHPTLKTLVTINSSGLEIYQVSNEPDRFLPIGEGLIKSTLVHGRHILLSTQSGLIRIDPNSLESAPLKMNSYENLNFTFQDKSDNWWYATNDGLVKDRLGNREFHLKGREVLEIREDNFGHIWAVEKFGISVYDGSQWYFLSEEKDEIPTTKIRTMHMDERGQIWLGTTKYGLVKVSYKSILGNVKDGFRYQTFIYSGRRNICTQANTVNQIIGWNGNLYLANFSAGVLKFDFENNSYKPYFFLDNRPMPYVDNMVVGPDSCLWFTCKDGLFRLDFETDDLKKVHIPSFEKSLIQPRTAVVLGRTLFIADRDKLIHLNIGDILSDSTLAPKVFFNQIKVNGADENQSISKTQKFSYLENNFEFYYGVVNYFNAKPNIFQYKLEGIHDEWQHTGKQTSVQFASLPPGKYNFKVKASNANYRWEKDYTEWSFSILPPYWDTLWFKFSILFLGCAGVFTWMKLKIQKKNNEQNFSNQIREKAAADFHDELGNRVARLSLFTEIIERSINNPQDETKVYVNRLKSTTQDIHHVMKDFLWTLDPTKDRALDLAILIRDFGEELFDGSGIDFHCNPIPDFFGNTVLSLDEKRHGLMIFKEAMTNVLKHSDATKIALRFTSLGSELVFEIEDNGVGIANSKISNGGLGIKNMYSRAKDMEAILSFESTKSKVGTAIKLKVLRKS